MYASYKTASTSKPFSNVRYNLRNRRLLRIMVYAGAVFALLVLIAYNLVGNGTDYTYEVFNNGQHKLYNPIYPLSSPTVRNSITTYKILAIADLDTKSKLDANGHKFSSFLLKGELKISDDLKEVNIDFESEPVEISQQYAYGDRGMELSELVTFNGHLYSCDDRTGIIYEILINDKLAIPWVILADGNGKNSGKGFKCEWMTVKNKKLYVGGLGKEWTTPQGVLVNHNPQWIKVIGHLGDVTPIDWTDNYNSIRNALGYSYPGYMIFESCVWSTEAQEFFFLPRRASGQSYDEVLDEQRATNLLINTDEDFKTISHKTVGDIIPTRGYSSFKFVPGTNEKLIIALKTEEDSGETRSYVTLIDTSGNVLIKDIQISNSLKFEGIEFI